MSEFFTGDFPSSICSPGRLFAPASESSFCNSTALSKLSFLTVGASTLSLFSEAVEAGFSGFSMGFEAVFIDGDGWSEAVLIFRPLESRVFFSTASL
ncbi:MAG: hypothetical protein V3V00_03325 [Saprospiraceae bacterium]